MHDHKKQSNRRPVSNRARSNGPRQESIWIKGRRYTIVEELGFRHRPRVLVFDCGSRCRRLLMRLPHDAATDQHLKVLRRLPRRDAVPQIIDSQIQGDQCLVVLSWTEGIDLGKYFQSVKRGAVIAPSAYESVRLVRGLVHGLLQLHQHAQLIHGDLKPENLILTRKPSYWAMIDYGSAWPVERTAFRDQGDGSSLLYTAPEMLADRQTGDFRSDQFSVSVILYQLLTGVVPFNGLGGQAGLKRFRRHFDGEPIPPIQISTVMGCLPKPLARELDRVVLRGLQVDPEARYPTTSAWLDAIETMYLKLKLRQINRDPSRWHCVIDWLASFVPPVE